MNNTQNTDTLKFFKKFSARGTVIQACDEFARPPNLLNEKISGKRKHRVKILRAFLGSRKWKHYKKNDAGRIKKLKFLIKNMFLTRKTC